MTYEYIKVEREGPVTIFTLNRPEVMNALHSPAHFELHEAFDAFAAAYEKDRHLIPAENLVEIRYEIADGYYLYRERFKFAAEGARLGTPELPRGLKHKDEFFGEVETYRKEVRIRLPVEGQGRLDLTVTSQGCADIGVCYVPMESRSTLQLTGLQGPSMSTGPRELADEPRFSIFASDIDIARLFEGNVALVLASFFVLGLLLTFTPCVLPMVPILSGIIAGEGRGLGKLRAAALSGAYVLGMALTYAAAGVAAASSGVLIASALQNVWVLGAFAVVFVVLAFSMFGFYELRLPGLLHQRLHGAHQQLRGGRILSVAAMGALSAIIVSPCVAAPLAGALLYISQTRDVLLGGSALLGATDSSGPNAEDPNVCDARWTQHGLEAKFYYGHPPSPA